MNKLINGINCISRDVVYSSFGRGNAQEIATTAIPKDVVYSWMDNDGVIETNYSESRDTEYAGQLPTRLMVLKLPIYVQLKDLYNDHSRLYKSRGSKLKTDEINLLIDDYRYELHRIIAKAKDVVILQGGNLESILRLNSFGSSVEVSKASKSLTVLFKRIETAYTSFGYVPRDYQIKMNDALSVLISHFILDIYGPELEKRKTATSVFAKPETDLS